MQKLELSEFEAALDRLGADIERWPEPLREAAQDLLVNSEAARRQHAVMLEIEAGLASAPPVTAPLGLADRIVARALAESPPKGKPRR